MGKSGQRNYTVADLVEKFPKVPMLVIPKGEDGSVDHAVCVVDDLIFDGTTKKAMLVGEESFQYVCGASGFECIDHVICFESGDKKKYKNTNLYRKIFQRNQKRHGSLDDLGLSTTAE